MALVGRLTRTAALAAALLIAPLALAGGAGANAAPADPSVIPNAYIVTLADSGDPSVVAARHSRAHGVQVDLVYRSALRGYAGRMSAAQARDLADDPSVAAVVPDRRVRIDAQTTPVGVARIGGTQSSAVAGDGRGAVDVDVAIIDTGIDTKHRDLNVVGGVNCVPGGLSYNDLNGHGTHVAGTVGAKDNNVGVVGVAPGARLWAVRVLTSGGWGSWSTIACGIDWVTARASTIEVANMSLGGGGSEGSCTDGGLHQAICASVARGVTYVVSAGNAADDARYFVPASFDEVITVSAITDFDGLPGGTGAPTCSIGSDDAFAFFSNYGNDVDLTAPGVCVLSTWRGNATARISGTSMASPHVAGAAALYTATHPDATPAQVRQALLDAGTFDWTGDPDGVQEPLVDVSSF